MAVSGFVLVGWASVLILGPPMLLITYALDRYENLFEVRRVFLMIVLGILAGLIALGFQLFLAEPARDNIGGGIIFVVGLALLETLITFVVLNWKGFRSHFATTYYGFALGAAMAMSMVFLNQSLHPTGFTPADLLDALVLVLFVTASAAYQGGLGAVMGIGAAESRPWPAFWKATGWRLYFQFALLGLLLGFWGGLSPVVYLVLVLPTGLYIAYNAHRVLFFDTLPDRLRRAVRRGLNKDPERFGELLEEQERQDDGEPDLT